MHIRRAKNKNISFLVLLIESSNFFLYNYAGTPKILLLLEMCHVSK